MWPLSRILLGAAWAALSLTSAAALAFFLTTAAITSSFDTARNSTGHSVLSLNNSKVTAAAGSPAATQFSAFANLTHSSGKYAFRVTENACASAGAQNCAVGLGPPSDPDNSWMGVRPGDVGILDSGQIRINGGIISSGGPTFLPGNTIDVEVDLDGKTIAYSVNGGAFSSPTSIATLSGGFTLGPGVTMSDPADAFTYDGTVSFPGFPAWNSAPSASGGGGGAVPAPAQAAGFTTVVVNDNFQDGTWDNTATWLDVCGASSPKYWDAWAGFGPPSVGCSTIGTAIDPVGGQKALRLHWQDSYRVLPSTSNSPNISAVQLSDAQQLSGTGRQTSPGFYLEVVARTDFVVGGSPNPWMDVWSYAPKLCGYEIDGFEEAGFFGGSFAIHNFCSDAINDNCTNQYCSCADSANGCAGAVVDVAQYHKYAWRQTGNGTDIVFCAYVDDIAYGCNSVKPSAAQLTTGWTMTHQIAVGSDGTLGNGSTGKNVYVKSLKILSCDTNSSNQCHTSSANP